MRLRKVTIYLSEEELAPLQAIADEEEVTLCAVVRAKLGLPHRRRGAPAANTNRQKLRRNNQTAHNQPDSLTRRVKSRNTKSSTFDQ